MIRTWLPVAFALLASLAMPEVRAQAAAGDVVPTHPALTDRFVMEVGGYYSRSATQASLSRTASGVGVVIDFEDTLGLEAQNWTPTAGFLWRITDRWRLEATYFELERGASRPLGSRVDWGNAVFPAGSTVETRFDFSDLRVSLGYSFFKRRDKEVGVGLGLHVAGVKASLQAAGIGGDAADVLAPLPVLDFYGLFALTNEWAMRARVDWLSLSYGPYSGDVRNFAVEALYQPFRHVGFGAGLRTLVVDLEIDKDAWKGKARTAFGGPTVFMTVSF